MSTTGAETVNLLLADARLPSGGHVSSSGLEPALMAGLPRERVPEFLAVRARTTGCLDAACAVVARHQLRYPAGRQPGPAAAEAVSRAWAARTPSQPQRAIARELGRGLLRLALSLWPEAEALQSLDPAPVRPVVLGAIAAHTGLGPEALARLVIYDDAAAAAAALLKLEPGDPAEAMGFVLAACAGAEHQVPALARLEEPGQLPAVSAPEMEHWIQRHTSMTRRLFRA